jgi:signal transduction histidine kinase
MQTSSIRFKVSILYTTILFFILSAYSAVLFYAIKHVLYGELDNVLKVKSLAVIDIINTYAKFSEEKDEMFIPVGNNVIYFNDHLKTDLERKTLEALLLSKTRELNLKFDYILFLTASGQPIVNSSNLDPGLSAIFVEKAKIPFFKKSFYDDISSGKKRIRMLTTLFAIHGQSRYIMQIGTSLSSVGKIMRTLSAFIGVSVLLILLLTSFMGTFFAKQILTPVMAITKTANNITQKDLHVRIGETAVDTEMRFLIDSLNNMIGRLEVSFNNINEFSSHVAHELKTHLTIIKGEIDLALMQDRSPEEYKRVLKIGSDEMNRVIRVINDLLLLAKIDFRLGILKFEKTDLCPFLTEVSEHSGILAAEKKIRVVPMIPDGPYYAMCDVVHLRRVLFNLVINAIKFTQPGGTISLLLEKDAAVYLLSVVDTGEGIAAENIPKIFNKFFRIERDGEIKEGSGLGLSIALAIAKAHGGDIKVESCPDKGSKFTVILPSL